MGHFFELLLGFFIWDASLRHSTTRSSYSDTLRMTSPPGALGWRVNAQLGKLLGGSDLDAPPNVRCRPTSVIGGKADMARACHFVR